LDARCPGLFRSIADDREFIGDSIAVEIRSHAARGAGERNHQAECDLHWRSMS
jgi:hypothetical protein